MFYSQFILAKKGPLGTIWVAAHLERKLRKNQVADTDIGDSVDSILQPEVPIALRLSSHLLLGVVRIYSRKVNYLFDDCSEALLKVKQAFRATDGDLPPEETTATYNSITLPETFDLDDYELPDNEIFQGNQANHHTSTMDQITLQDNMEGVVYPTSQFGMDDTFGDGETSSLKLDEDLVLNKEDTAGDAAASSDHQLSDHVASPKQDEGFREMPANQESMIKNLDSQRGLMDYTQPPSTPGMVETSDIENVQEISACEDHMDEDEDEDLPLVVSVANGSSETISEKSSPHQENAQPSRSSLPDDNLTAAVDLPCDENRNHLIDLNVEKRFDSSDFGVQNVSNDGPLTASVISFAIADETQALGQVPNSSGFGQLGPQPVPDVKDLAVAVDLPLEKNQNNLIDLNIEKRLYSNDFRAQNVSIDRTVTPSRTSFAFADKVHDLHQTQNSTEMATLVSMHRDRSQDFENVNLESDGVNGQSSVLFKNHGEYSAIISKESSQEASISISSSQLPRGVPDDNQIASYEDRSKDMEVSRSSSRPVCSDGTLDLNFEHRGLSSVDKPEDTHTFNGAVSGEMLRNQVHILRPCRTGSELSDSSHNMAPDVGVIWESHGVGERIHLSGHAVAVQDNAVMHNLNVSHAAGPGSIKDNHAGSGISYNQVNNVRGDCMLKNVSSSLSTVFSAPEKQYSVADVHYNQPRDIPENMRMYNGAVFDDTRHSQQHILRPSRTGLDLSDPSHYMAPDVSAVSWESPGSRETMDVSGRAVSVQGLIRESPGGRERIHMSRPAVVVQGPVSTNDISGSGKSYNQANNVIGGGSMMKHVNGSFGAMFTASGNQLPVLDVYNNQPRDLPEVTRMFNGAVFDEMPRTQLHNLRPCRAGLELADSSHDMAPDVSAFPQESPGGRERINVSQPAGAVQDDASERNLNENQKAGSYPIKDIHAGPGKSYNQVNDFGGDMFKKVSSSLSSATSAPQKQWSLQDIHNNQARGLPENSRIFNRAVFEEMPHTQLHMLRPSMTGLELADSSHGMAPSVGAIPRESSGGWESVHRSGPSVSVQDNALEVNENRSADINAGYGMSFNQVNSVVGGDSMPKNANGSPSAIFSAPEKLMAPLDMRKNQPRDLAQDTPMFNGAGFDGMAHTQLHIPSPYRTGLEHTDSSHHRSEVSNVLGMAPNFGAIPQESPGGWERVHVSEPVVVVQDNASVHNLNNNHNVVSGSVKDIHAGSGGTYDQVNYAVGGDSMLRNVSGSLGPMYSAPEMMMSVPDVRNNQPRDLPVQATPTNIASLYEKNDAGSGMNFWKKRSYTESTPTEQSLNSVDSARVPTNKSNEAIRNDNDYLSSILVGRGSSALNVKPTPPLPPHEMASVKRQRRGPKANAPKAYIPQFGTPQAGAPHAGAPQASAPRANAPRASVPRVSAHKRKVLMDDMLVLHGDIIRQQLINTVDIKRLRKKATCTRPETSVILKLSSEDEIFGEPICSGTSVVLASLFNQSYNISKIQVSKDGVSSAPASSSSDKKFISANERIENAPGSVTGTVLENDARDHGEFAVVKENSYLHLDETIVLNKNISDAYVGPDITNLDFNPTENKDEIEEPVISSLPNLPQKITENEIISTNVSSEVVDIGPMSSQYRGVGAEASVDMEAEAFSSDNDMGFDTVNSDDSVSVNEEELHDQDTGRSYNVMVDASLESGSMRNVVDTGVDTVNSGYTVTLNVVESNDNNYIYGSKNMMLDASLINGREKNDKNVRCDMVNSGVNSVRLNEVESNKDARFDKVNSADTVKVNEGSSHMMLDASSINGSYSNVNDVRFEAVKSDDNTVTVNEIESSKKDSVLSKGDKHADIVETEDLYIEQAQLVDYCSPSTRLENHASTKNCNEPSCGPTTGGISVVTSLYPPGFGASGGSPAVTSLYPPGFGASGGSPAVTSLYPPGFGTSDVSPAVTSLYPPGFSTSSGSPVVSSLYPPGFDTSGGSPIVTSLYPPGFGDAQDPVLDGSKSPVQEDVNASSMVGAESSDGSKSPIQEDVNPSNVVGAESSDGSKSPIPQDVNPTKVVVAESPGLDTQDYNDINSPADDADDTGFLNDDDDDDYEVAEVADDNAPNAEDTRIIDNSGWSSRTRAVANYLQTVFTKEAEYDKKVVPIDHLLVGKTRKEACRMFFETLVLKTKDYIQVEQEGPFGNINVKPKMKLLKSEF